MERSSSPFYKAATESAVALDQGLRVFVLKVFNYMGCGLAMTGIIAYLVSTSEMLSMSLFSTGLHWFLFIAQIGICIFMGFRIHKIQASTAQALFWAFSATMGISLAPIFLVYTGESIATTFFVTSSMFLSMSLYGYTTKKDLSGLGTILFMGLIGLIIASIVNSFMQNSMATLVISALGVLIFTGLTAWDMQKIKNFYWEGDSQEIYSKKAVIGALNLYLDFINLFLYLLKFLGARRD